MSPERIGAENGLDNGAFWISGGIQDGTENPGYGQVCSRKL